MQPSGQEEDATAILKELKEISNRYSCSRHEHKLVASSDPSRASELTGKENANVERDGQNDPVRQNKFLQQTGENSDLNQYWYSKTTIDTLCNAIRECNLISGGKRIAFLSTPSLFFSLSEEERENCVLFDVRLYPASAFLFYIINSSLVLPFTFKFDTSWNSCGGYHFYDYNDPTNIEDSCFGQFDLVVIDPPFISQSVWELYAVTAKLLLKKDASSVIATTVDENAVLMAALFDCKPVLFRPSIPHLVYQYSVFVNFESSTLAHKNTELK